MLTSQHFILVLSTYTVSHGKILIFSNFRQNKHLTPTPHKLSYQLHSTLLTCLVTVSRMGYPWVAKMLQYFSDPLQSARLYVQQPGKTIHFLYIDKCLKTTCSPELKYVSLWYVLSTSSKVVSVSSKVTQSI